MADEFSFDPGQSKFYSQTPQNKYEAMKSEGASDEEINLEAIKDVAKELGSDAWEKLKSATEATAYGVVAPVHYIKEEVKKSTTPKQREQAPGLPFGWTRAAEDPIARALSVPTTEQGEPLIEQVEPPASFTQPQGEWDWSGSSVYGKALPENVQYYPKQKGYYYQRPDVQVPSGQFEQAPGAPFGWTRQVQDPMKTALTVPTTEQGEPLSEQVYPPANWAESQKGWDWGENIYGQVLPENIVYNPKDKTYSYIRGKVVPGGGVKAGKSAAESGFAPYREDPEVKQFIESLVTGETAGVGNAEWEKTQPASPLALAIAPNVGTQSDDRDIIERAQKLLPSLQQEQVERFIEEQKKGTPDVLNPYASQVKLEDIVSIIKEHPEAEFGTQRFKQETLRPQGLLETLGFEYNPFSMLLGDDPALGYQLYRQFVSNRGVGAHGMPSADYWKNAEIPDATFFNLGRLTRAMTSDWKGGGLLPQTIMDLQEVPLDWWNNFGGTKYGEPQLRELAPLRNEKGEVVVDEKGAPVFPEVSQYLEKYGKDARTLRELLMGREPKGLTVPERTWFGTAWEGAMHIGGNIADIFSFFTSIPSLPGQIVNNKSTSAMYTALGDVSAEFAQGVTRPIVTAWDILNPIGLTDDKAAAHDRAVALKFAAEHPLDLALGTAMAIAPARGFGGSVLSKIESAAKALEGIDAATKLNLGQQMALAIKGAVPTLRFVGDVASSITKGPALATWEIIDQSLKAWVIRDGVANPNRAAGMLRRFFLKKSDILPAVLDRMRVEARHSLHSVVQMVSAGLATMTKEEALAIDKIVAGDHPDNILGLDEFTPVEPNRPLLMAPGESQAIAREANRPSFIGGGTVKPTIIQDILTDVERQRIARVKARGGTIEEIVGRPPEEGVDVEEPAIPASTITPRTHEFLSPEKRDAAIAEWKLLPDATIAEEIIAQMPAEKRVVKTEYPFLNEKGEAIEGLPREDLTVGLGGMVAEQEGLAHVVQPEKVTLPSEITELTIGPKPEPTVSIATTQEQADLGTYRPFDVASKEFVEAKKSREEARVEHKRLVDEAKKASEEHKLAQDRRSEFKRWNDIRSKWIDLLDQEKKAMEGYEGYDLDKIREGITQAVDELKSKPPSFWSKDIGLRKYESLLKDFENAKQGLRDASNPKKQARLEASLEKLKQETNTLETEYKNAQASGSKKEEKRAIKALEKSQDKLTALQKKFDDMHSAASDAVDKYRAAFDEYHKLTGNDVLYPARKKLADALEAAKKHADELDIRHEKVVTLAKELHRLRERFGDKYPGFETSGGLKKAEWLKEFELDVNVESAKAVRQRQKALETKIEQAQKRADNFKDRLEADNLAKLDYAAKLDANNLPEQANQARQAAKEAYDKGLERHEQLVEAHAKAEKALEDFNKMDLAQEPIQETRYSIEVEYPTAEKLSSAMADLSEQLSASGKVDNQFLIDTLKKHGLDPAYDVNGKPLANVVSETMMEKNKAQARSRERIKSEMKPQVIEEATPAPSYVAEGEVAGKGGTLEATAMLQTSDWPRPKGDYTGMEQLPANLYAEAYLKQAKTAADLQQMLAADGVRITERQGRKLLADWNNAKRVHALEGENEKISQQIADIEQSIRLKEAEIEAINSLPEDQRTARTHNRRVYARRDIADARQAIEGYQKMAADNAAARAKLMEGELGGPAATPEEAIAAWGPGSSRVPALKAVVEGERYSRGVINKPFADGTTPVDMILKLKGMGRTPEEILVNLQVASNGTGFFKRPSGGSKAQRALLKQSQLDVIRDVFVGEAGKPTQGVDWNVEGIPQPGQMAATKPFARGSSAAVTEAISELETEKVISDFGIKITDEQFKKAKTDLQAVADARQRINERGLKTGTVNGIAWDNQAKKFVVDPDVELLLQHTIIYDKARQLDAAKRLSALQGAVQVSDLANKVYSMLYDISYQLQKIGETPKTEAAAQELINLDNELKALDESDRLVSEKIARDQKKMAVADENGKNVLRKSIEEKQAVLERNKELRQENMAKRPGLMREPVFHAPESLQGYYAPERYEDPSLFVTAIEKMTTAWAEAFNRADTVSALTKKLMARDKFLSEKAANQKALEITLQSKKTSETAGLEGIKTGVLEKNLPKQKGMTFEQRMEVGRIADIREVWPEKAGQLSATLSRANMMHRIWEVGQQLVPEDWRMKVFEFDEWKANLDSNTPMQIGKIKVNPNEYMVMPDEPMGYNSNGTPWATKRYGELSGKVVHKDVYQAVVIAEEMSKSIPYLTKALSIAKSAKTVWNPAGHVRNFWANVFLFATVEEISPFNPKNWPLYAEVLADRLPGRKKSDWYWEGHRAGVYDGQFTQSELASKPANEAVFGLFGDMSRFAENVKQFISKTSNASERARMVEGLAGKIADIPSAAYAMSDEIFRDVAWRKAMREKGYTYSVPMGHEDVSRKAVANELADNKRASFVDYNNTSMLVQMIARPNMYGGSAAKWAHGIGWTLVYGKPFFVFPAQALPMLTSRTQMRPLEFLAMTSAANAIMYATASTQGVSKEEVNAIVENRQKRYQNSKITGFGRDENGDLTVKWTDFSEGAIGPDLNVLAQPGTESFMSQVVGQLGQNFIGQPFINTIKGRDALGRPLWEAAVPGEDDNSYLRWMKGMFDVFAPPLYPTFGILPESYYGSQVTAAEQGRPDALGRMRTPEEVYRRALLAQKSVTETMPNMAAEAVMGMSREISNVMKNIYAQETGGLNVPQDFLSNAEPPAEGQAPSEAYRMKEAINARQKQAMLTLLNKYENKFAYLPGDDISDVLDLIYDAKAAIEYGDSDANAVLKAINNASKAVSSPTQQRRLEKLEEMPATKPLPESPYGNFLGDINELLNYLNEQGQ